MHYEILDKKRIDILPLLGRFKDEFYLAGGTALALQIGHRDSVDFDFFSTGDIDTVKLFSRVEEIFSAFSILKIQEEKNTLTVLIDKTIKIIFFSYAYPLLDDFIEDEYFKLASIRDIACMKVSAILGRATNKDYIDLYFILQKMDLPSLLDAAQEKFPHIETNLILKSLVYFEDINPEPIIFKNNLNVSMEEVEGFLKRIVVI